MSGKSPFKMGNRVLYIADRVAHYHVDMLRSLERELAEHGCEFFLLSGVVDSSDTGRVGSAFSTLAKEGKYKYREIHLGSFTLRMQYGILAKIKKIKPDIVIVHSHVGNITSWRLMSLKLRLGFKLVSWQCGYEYNSSKLKDILLKRYIAGFDHHLAYHTNAKKYAMKHGADEERITVFHNTINDEKIKIIPKHEARREIVSRFPAIGDRKILLFVGAVLKEKRLDFLVEVMDSLKCNDVYLLVVGDGPWFKELEKLCGGRADVGLSGAVVENVGLYFDAADIFLLPGTGGLAINEAMIHGLPIISGYADGSADDLVINGVNGYLIANGGCAEWVDRIACLVGDDEKMQAMGAASKGLIADRFSFSQLINRVSSVLVKL